MKAWWAEFVAAARAELRLCLNGLRTCCRELNWRSPQLLAACLLAGGLLLWAALTTWTPSRTTVPQTVETAAENRRPSYKLPSTPPPPIPTPDYRTPVREIPKNFRLNAIKPPRAESSVSGSIADTPFDPARDLIRVEDKRVWWESENDDHTGDDEDDHIMHWAMEDPFRRLVELVEKEGGQLKVQDSYRAVKVHGKKSLHKQGRGIDVTAFDIPLGRLAALCWAAGFDWVYFEEAGGHHIHASVTPKGKIRRTFEPAVANASAP